MKPIFNEQIQMWSDLGFNIPIKEGYYWLDNGIIKAFTPDGQLHKLYKYKVNDDLTINITKYQDSNLIKNHIFETWEETVERNSERLSALENESLDLIRRVMNDYADYDMYISTSTGKDSMVTLDLVHRVNPNVPVLFNNTSLDCADTYKMVKSHKDWIVTNPKEGFYQWVKRIKFIPTRFSRACCTLFKEGLADKYFKKLNNDKLIQFMGVRNDESAKRADREDMTQSPKWNNDNWYACLPIRKWSEFDIWIYILKYSLEINPKYRKGYHRCGCAMACPYATKYTWVLDKYWYPKMFDRWRNILKEFFINTFQWTQKNCTMNEFVVKEWGGGIMRPEPTEEVINEFMEYKGITDRNIALQYFNKTCCECGKNVRQNDVLAMNLKMNGRNTNKIYCKKCLMKELNMSKDEWDNNVVDFKAQGCKLF